MDKPKKGETVKSWFKVFGITAACTFAFILLIVGIVEFFEKQEFNNEVKA